MDTRYDRQIKLIGEEGQEFLRNGAILIIGCGGLGNIAAKFLASSGVGTIAVTDYDKVEVSNLNRQLLFNKESVGVNKAVALKKTLKKINPEITVIEGQYKFTKNNKIEVNAGWDVILDCSDNLETSYALEKEAIRLGIPLVFAKTSKYFGVVTVIKNKPYLQNNYPKKQLNKDNSVFPVIGGIVGSYQANLTLKLLLGLKVTDKVIHFDCLNDSIIQYEKDGSNDN